MNEKKSLTEKLLEIQISVDQFVKDGYNQSDKYSFVSSDKVLEVIRPKMNELRLLLIPSVRGHALHEGTTKTGTTRYFTELDLDFEWVDCEGGERMQIPFYAQGVDLAGEKGVGKALTYAEKYFLMKFFHVPTSKDDPDGTGRVASTKKPAPPAEKKSPEYYVLAVTQMLDELCGGDTGKVKQSLVSFTRSKTGGGVDDLLKVSEAALPVLFAKVKRAYEDKTGHPFRPKEGQNAD